MVRLVHVATYRRVVGASAERIWENALDWEHLPWLHRSSFTGIDLLDHGSEFWRARVTFGKLIPRAVVLELRIDRARLAYVTRTLEGGGAGTEIRTELEPAGERATRVSVEFHVAGVARLFGPLVGAGYKRLYGRLWSEDETMMQRRQAVLDGAASRRAERTGAGGGAPAAVELGREAELRARLPLVVETPRGPVRVLELAEGLVAHPTTCPHRGGPLEDAAVVDGAISCPWHGYAFDVRTGAPVGSHRCRLPPGPRVIVDAATREARLVWSDADWERTPTCKGEAGERGGDPS